MSASWDLFIYILFLYFSDYKCHRRLPVAHILFSFKRFIHRQQTVEQIIVFLKNDYFIEIL